VVWFLLDTNIVIALLAGENAVIAGLDQASEVFVRAIVVDVNKSGRLPKRHLDRRYHDLSRTGSGSPGPPFPWALMA
jgi:predicted nucleic acid-binding protein